MKTGLQMDDRKCPFANSNRIHIDASDQVRFDGIGQLAKSNDDGGEDGGDGDGNDDDGDDDGDGDDADAR